MYRMQLIEVGACLKCCFPICENLLIHNSLSNLRYTLLYKRAKVIMINTSITGFITLYRGK